MTLSVSGMNGGIGLLLVGLIVVGGLVAIAVAGNRAVSTGTSPTDCAGMHGSNAPGHAQCAGEARSGSHASCDATGMPPTQCDEMATYMGGGAMASPCH